MKTNTLNLEDYVHAVPNFPKQGIMFRDISPLLASPDAFRHCIDEMHIYWQSEGYDKIVALDARGFIFASALAYVAQKPLVMARKPGKLPGDVKTIDYGLEYGKNTLAIQRGSITRGDTLLVVDDVLATGGSAKAATTLVEKLGGHITGIHCVLELEGLKGRDVLSNYMVRSQIQYK